jgi:hypothetical protein
MNDTSKLIESLSAELPPQTKVYSPLLWGTVTAVFSAVFMAVMAYSVFYVRPDALGKLQTADFFFDVVVMTFTGVAAIYAAFYSSVPGGHSKRWLMSVPLTSLAIFLIWSVGQGIEKGFHLEGLHMDSCYGKEVLFLFVPVLISTVLVFKKGATTRPIQMAVLLALGLSAFAYVTLRFACPMDTIGHALVTHALPMLLLGLIMSLTARRIFYW